MQKVFQLFLNNSTILNPNPMDASVASMSKPRDSRWRSGWQYGILKCVVKSIERESGEYVRVFNGLVGLTSTFAPGPTGAHEI